MLVQLSILFTTLCAWPQAELDSGGSSFDNQTKGLYLDLTGVLTGASAKQGNADAASLGGYGLELALGYRYPSWIIYGLSYSYSGLEHYSNNASQVGNYRGAFEQSIRPFVTFVLDRNRFRLEGIFTGTYRFENSADAAEVKMAQPEGFRIQFGKTVNWYWEWGFYFEQISFERWSHQSEGDIDLSSPLKIQQLGLFLRWLVDFSSPFDLFSSSASSSSEGGLE